MVTGGFVVEGVLGCSRQGAPTPSEAGAPSALPPDPVAIVPEPASRAHVAPSSDALSLPPSGEANRSVLTSLEAEPLLRPFLSTLREHFKGVHRGPFAMQRIALAGERTARS